METCNSLLGSLDFGDVLSVMSLLFVVVGGIFALIQWNKTQSIRRSEYIHSLIEKLRSDNRINHIFYKIDSEEEWSFKDSFSDNDFEIDFDKALSYYSYICYLRKKKILKNDDFIFFQYEIDRVVTNKEVIRYFYNYYHFCKNKKLPNAYKYLFEYAVEKNVIAEDFYDPKAYQKNDSYSHEFEF